MKSPLKKRVLRELIGEWKKYLIVALFLIVMIGFVSGMYVANGSMLKAAENGKKEYNLEDGHFIIDKEADKELIKDIEALKPHVTLYENFYKESEELFKNGKKTNKSDIRIFRKTEDINLASVLEGELPDKANEIAIDRMHADNVGIKTGDTITIDGKEFVVSGLIAFVNYSTLHQKNSDMIFDAITFDVAMVNEEAFDNINEALVYDYAWKYKDEPDGDYQLKKYSDDFVEKLAKKTISKGYMLKDYLPVYLNNAVNFATDDMGKDEAMGGVLLDILVVVIAFIFGITIATTIEKECEVIGTLRASGYSKGELTRHYMSMPIVVTLISALIGNILGYTVFKDTVVSMYYNSYSLPAYKTIWHPEAFIKTTLIPIILMLLVNVIVIRKQLNYSPLQFLRGNLKKKKQKRAIKLPNIRFFSRFRIRVFIENIANYIVMFIGILFVMVMLAMAVGMPETLDYYKENTSKMMFARYQYILTSTVDKQGNEIKADTKEAEKFSIKSLLFNGGNHDEEISIYGIEDNSRYVDIEKLKDDEVYISESYKLKYNIKEGDTITLKEKYQNKEYTFKVTGIYDKCLGLSVFTQNENFRKIFDLDKKYFSGYISDKKITNIDKTYIASVITKKEITKMCSQLDHSMGDYMTYFQYACIILSAFLIYLLTKIIVEKNEKTIALTKILGYKNGELVSLYLRTTTIVVIISDIISIFIGKIVMVMAWNAIINKMDGYFEFVVSPLGYVKMFMFVLLGYTIVSIIDFRRIKKIPMERVLKNIE